MKLRSVSKLVLKLSGYSVVGTFAVGSAVVLHRNDYDLSSIGLIRLTRAGLAAATIFADYKYSLYGLDDGSKEYYDLKSEVHSRSASRLLKLACANGGVWIKVGQHVGALEYLLPSEYTSTLSTLHSRAPRSSLEQMEKVFKEDTGIEISEAFETFDPTPIGSASLAQVHKATVRQSGAVVGVKIQYPRVKAHSYVDMKVMEGLVRTAAYLFPEFKLIWLVKEMKKNLPVELDFMHEGRTAERVARMFGKMDFLKVPKIFWEYSSPRVLTMEFCEGNSVSDLQYQLDNAISRTEVCKDLGRLYSEMIFVQGFVHCDPHPGNVLVHKHPRHGLQLVLLDHGLYTTLQDSFRVAYSNLWLSLLKADLDGIKKYAVELGVGELYALFACMLTGRSWKAVTHGIDKKEVDAKETDEIQNFVGSYLPQISDVLNRVPSPILLILKTNDLLRGIEWNLKTQNSGYSFLYMSKCCTRSVHDHAYKHAESRFEKFQILTSKYWILSKLNLWEMFLICRELMGCVCDRILRKRITLVR